MAVKREDRLLKLERAVDAYFRHCRDQGEIPCMAGLALALGYGSRQELERDLPPDGTPKKRAALLLRARTRIEEANVQAAYRRDTAAGAKFMLQSEFGYAGKDEEALPGVISVRAEE